MSRVEEGNKKLINECFLWLRMVMKDDINFCESFIKDKDPYSKSYRFKKFKDLYDKLSEEEKDDLLTSYGRLQSRLDSKEKHEEIEIPITHREYLNRCVKTIQIEKGGKEFISKIPISPDPLPIERDITYQSLHLKLKFPVKNQEEWEIHDMDIIHTLNEEELLNKVVTLPCGKVVSIKRINEEMTLDGFGLCSEDGKTVGKVILRTKPREKTQKQLPSVAKGKESSIKKYNKDENKGKVGIGAHPESNSTPRKERQDENPFFFYVVKYEGAHWGNGKTTYIFYGEFFKFSVNIHYNINEKNQIEEFTKPRADIKEGVNEQETIIYIQILFAGYFETKKKAEEFINNFHGSSVENKQISKSKRYYSTQDYYYKFQFGMIPLIIPIPEVCEHKTKGYLLFYNHLKNKTANDFLLLEIIA